MKNLLLLFFLLPVQVSSQNFFPDGEAEWYINRWISCEDCSELLYKAKMSGDTTIGDHSYKILYEAPIYNGNTMSTWNRDTAFVRTDEHLVFVYNPITEEEELLYDFSLEPGDVFDTWNYVFEVDYIQMEDGSFRKRWHMATLDSSPDLVWIEGIGNIYSIVNSTQFQDGLWVRLACFKNENTIIYSNPMELAYNAGDFGCDGIVSTTELVYQASSVKIFPNPANQFLNIEYDGKIKSIEVIDLSGKIIYKTSVNNSALLKINTAFWENGLYLISINGQTQKIIINH